MKTGTTWGQPLIKPKKLMNLPIAVTSADRRNRAINICRGILANTDSYVIADTETSGWQHAGGEIMEIACIDPAGKTLLREFRHPTKPCSADALAVHGLTFEKLEKYGARPFSEWAGDLTQILIARTLLAFNAPFDIAIIKNTRYFEERVPVSDHFEGAICIMKLWRDFTGGQGVQKLEGDHSALGDCIATLARIKTMAAAELTNKPPSRSFDELAQELDEIGRQSKALKTAESDIKAEMLAKLTDKSMDKAVLEDGRSISIESNIVKLKALKSIDLLISPYVTKVVNKKAVEALIKSGKMTEQCPDFSWEYSRFVKVSSGKSKAK